MFSDIICGRMIELMLKNWDSLLTTKTLVLEMAQLLKLPSLWYIKIVYEYFIIVLEAMKFSDERW